jgi:hypothetical protein
MAGALQITSVLVFAAIFLIAAVGLGFAVYADRKSRASQRIIPEEQRGKYPAGRWMGIGLGFGMLMGLPLGLALQNVAVGPAFGLCIGVAVGRTLEERHKAEIRPLTAEEKRGRSRLTAVGLILVALVVASVAVLLYMVEK